MVAAIPGPAPRHYVYLDEQRTHEVHAELAEGSFVTTEFPAGSRDPSEVVTANTPVRGEAQLVALLGELEERLAHTGSYWRTDTRELRWTPLAAPKTAMDLRAHEAPIPGRGAMRIHHFHAGREERDRLLISLPREGHDGRHVLAEMRFDFPFLDQGEINVLHTRLSAPLLVSAVAKEHIEAPRKGYAKLVETRDYERAYGRDWAAKAKTLFRNVGARFIGGLAPTPEPIAAPASPAPEQAPARLAAMRKGLAHSRVEALKSRFIDPASEARLVESGEHAIRRYVNSLRKHASHDDTYELSLLEAALLLEYAIPGEMWDLVHAEGGKLLRYLHGYDA